MNSADYQSESAEIEREDIRRESRPRRLFRCADRMCGGLDCATCYGEAAAREFILKEEQDDCPHDEHDHGICLSCAKDINDDMQGEAEHRADCSQDR
jgi:hypothetical protein